MPYSVEGHPEARTWIISIVKVVSPFQLAAVRLAPRHTYHRGLLACMWPHLWRLGSEKSPTFSALGRVSAPALPRFGQP
jgi:hypothetical protein